MSNYFCSALSSCGWSVSRLHFLMMSNTTASVLGEMYSIGAQCQMCLFPSAAGNLKEDWHPLFVKRLQGHISYPSLPVFLNFMLFGKKDSCFLLCFYVKPWSFGTVQQNKTSG